MTEALVQPTVLSVFEVAPRRIGGVEMLAAELSRSLRSVEWRSILAFPANPSEPVSRFFADCGAQVTVAPELFKGGVTAARSLFSLVRQTKAQHVSLSFVPILSLLPWAARAAGAKSVFFTDQASRPEGEMPRPARGAKLAVGKFLARPYTKVFCISNYIRNENATRGYVPQERLTTLYNSIDFHRTSDEKKGAEFRRKFNINTDKVLVSQVSWLRPEKGIEDLIRAAVIARAQDPRLHFLIAGDGAFRDHYVQLSQQLGIADAVTFAGLVEDPMADGLYAASHIMCQLSRWQEAFAWVIAEAMAHAKPLIGTRVGGIPEVVEDGVTGFLVPPSDPDAVAQRILEFSHDQGLRTRMGGAGYSKALKEFNLVDNVAELLSAFGAFKHSGVQTAAVAANTL